MVPTKVLSYKPNHILDYILFFLSVDWIEISYVHVRIRSSVSAKLIYLCTLSRILLSQSVS